VVAAKEGGTKMKAAEATDRSIKGSRAKGIIAAAATLPADRTLILIGQDRRMRKKSISPFLANGWVSPR
jgi:hypothetical protein